MCSGWPCLSHSLLNSLAFLLAARSDLHYPKGFALCRQPLLDAQDQSERVELEILRILLQEMARDLDSGAKICSATFW